MGDRQQDRDGQGVQPGQVGLPVHTSASKDQISIRQELLRVAAWLLPD